MEKTVFCPVCQMDIPVPKGAKSGEKVDCPN
jgi:hypothetical protein